LLANVLKCLVGVRVQVHVWVWVRAQARGGGVVMGAWLAVVLAHEMTSCRKPMNEIYITHPELPTRDYPLGITCTHQGIRWVIQYLWLC